MAETSIGVPGEFPYTRGIYPTMYRGRLWTMRQYAGFGTAAQSNQRYRYLLAKGTNGIIGRVRSAHADWPGLRSPSRGR